MCFLLLFGIVLAMNVSRRLSVFGPSTSDARKLILQFTKAASSTPQYLHLYYSNESWWLLRLQHFDLKRQFIILFLFHPRVIQTHMTDCGEIFREMSQCFLSILCLLEEMQSQLCVIWVNDDRMLILGWTVTFWTTMNSFSVYAVEQMRLREGFCVRLLNSS